MTFKTTKCRHCRIEFRYPAEMGVVKYCSGLCRVSHVPPSRPEEYKGVQGASYYSKGRRRKIRRGDHIDAYVVYVYYDWTCHLCDNEIDPSLMAPDPGCATLDHIVELSQGGRHEWENIAPSHLSCNLSKSQ